MHKLKISRCKKCRLPHVHQRTVAILPRPNGSIDTSITQPWLSPDAIITQIGSMFTRFHRFTALITTMLMLALTPMAGQAEDIRIGPDTIDVFNNSGGNVLQMVQRREDLARSGKRVRIRGYCRSACTMLITLPNACLGPNARVGFHAPRIPNTSIIPPYVDQIMGNFYRNGIRDRWFAGWNRSLKMTIISARDYVRLDPETRICSDIPVSRKKRQRGG